MNVMRIGPQGAVAFFAKDRLKALFTSPGKTTATPLQTLAACMCTGIIAQTATYPIDTVRTRMMTTPGLYRGLADGAKTIVSTEGFRALFTGLYPATLFAVPYFGTQFFSYDRMRLTYAMYGMEPGKQRKMKGWAALPMNNVVSPLVSFLSHGFPYKFTKHFVLFSAPIFLLCPFFFTLSPHYFIFFFTY